MAIKKSKEVDFGFHDESLLPKPRVRKLGDNMQRVSVKTYGLAKSLRFQLTSDYLLQSDEALG